MASVNKAIIIGRLGADPELRYTSAETPVATFNIATTERFKNRNGENQERTEWLTIVALVETGQLAKEYLKKGNPVYIEGRIQTRSYDDRDGIKRYKTEIVAQQMQFLGSRGTAEQSAPTDQIMDDNIPEPQLPADDDDLPF